MSPTLKPWPRFPRYQIGSDGTIVGPRGKPLRPFVDKTGYAKFNVSTGTTSRVQVSVHIVVCETFHGARPERAHAGHRDGDQTNNAAANLRWVTQQQNEADKREHGTAMQGERHHQHVLTEADVIAIRAARKAGAKLRALAAQFGVTETTISYAANGRTWGHI